MMPVPCFNVINGGSHAGNKLAFQEYFVIPTGAANFAEGMQIGTEVYHNLAKILKKKFGGDSTHLTYHDPSLHTTTHLHPQPILHTTTHLTYRNPSYIPQPISCYRRLDTDWRRGRLRAAVRLPLGPRADRRGHRSGGLLWQVHRRPRRCRVRVQGQGLWHGRRCRLRPRHVGCKAGAHLWRRPDGHVQGARRRVPHRHHRGWLRRGRLAQLGEHGRDDGREGSFSIHSFRALFAICRAPASPYVAPHFPHMSRI